jgi:hypothetical protein
MNDIFNRVFDERSVRIVLVETRDENGDAMVLR